jgi:hypothetical protein
MIQGEGMRMPNGSSPKERRQITNRIDHSQYLDALCV